MENETRTEIRIVIPVKLVSVKVAAASRGVFQNCVKRDRMRLKKSRRIIVVPISNERFSGSVASLPNSLACIFRKIRNCACQQTEVRQHAHENLFIYGSTGTEVVDECLANA